MEIRKWMIILVITGVLGKLFAMGLSQVRILPRVAELEKRAEMKIAQIFSHDTKPVVEEKPAPLPRLLKTTAVKVVQKPVTVFKPLNPVAEKKSPQALAQEEKERRKKRKKKLEKEADKKKPEMAVTVLGQDQKVKAKTEEPIGSIFFTLAPKKEEPVEVAPISAKPRVDLNMWLKLLTTQPLPSNLKSFVGLYKTGQITANDYYTVMANLQKSTNKDARNLAILGSSIEAHVLAYSILVHEKYSESVLELQTLANSSLQIYKNAKYLNFLIQPLTSGDVFVKIESSDTIGAIAQSLKATPTALTADVRAALNHSITILTPLTKDASQQLQASATQTLKLVKAILGLTT